MSGGSSPLVRGQQSNGLGKTVNERIIPARAGPTITDTDTASAATDHPRSCGANAIGSVILIRTRGSSPLVRGQHERINVHDIRVRIIPARAGPTERCRAMPGDWTDHPRSCGANILCGFLVHFSSGSSPLVRGQPVHRFSSHGNLRIIPARAGPTLFYTEIL